MTVQRSSASLRGHGAFVLAVSLLVGSSGVAAQAKSLPSRQAGTERHQYTAEESKRLGDEAQRAAEAKQAIWDQRLRAISGSICTGC